MKREKCLLLRIYGQTLGQTLMEKVSLEIHNFNTTSQISVTSFHLWYNHGPSLFSPFTHHISWSTMAIPLCFTYGFTHYKRPQLLMACYSNCMPCLSHMHYHFFCIICSSSATCKIQEAYISIHTTS